jgi:hypothetical protein
MAYLDLSLASATLAGAPAAAAPVAAAAIPDDIREVCAAFRALGAFGQSETLTDLEWRVVELARDDSLKTLRPVQPRKGLARLILGATPPSKMLADARLEALRKLAVQAWHMGYTIPASAMRQAIRAGYSDLQVGAVIDTIVGHRVTVRGATRGSAA